MNINSSLTRELREKQYRDAYVASQIQIGLPFQIRALRKSRNNMTQSTLATTAQMSQPRISEIESPGERHLNIETLLRLASAFDVALEVRFVPFSQLIDRSESFDPENFAVDSFEAEIAKLEEEQLAAAAEEEAMSFYRPIERPTLTASKVLSFPEPAEFEWSANGTATIQDYAREGGATYATVGGQR